ncbi:hypothetical protein VIGAN_03296600 [Vigna angularis var. angularis]|uniref:Transposase-associated domain-containing protein n=2 Tax=Phaseolus angularis TaxID=3914 RepID=A0A0S3RQP8_PHAAN|nr:uncharacterized protein LOC108336470 isoform X2 [Vigna angularis]BAT82894.1 hypothetical protein VIGAN_03296600 [Vigna angularis var. angularis]
MCARRWCIVIEARVLRFGKIHSGIKTMDQFPSNRAWMYDRNHRGRGALKVSFVFGVEEFITKACEQDRYHNDGGVRCPCIKCDCTKILEKRVVKVHLYKHGFKPNYLIWTDHGEQMPEGDLDNDGTSMGVETDGERNDQFMLMQDMVHDVDRCTSSSACVASNQSTPTTNVTPSPPISIPGTHSSSTVNELDVEEDSNHRPMIRPIGAGFYPSKTASKAITATIKQKFDQPWLTWGAIPKRERGLFFQCFKIKVSWRVEDEDKVLKNFRSKASHRLLEMFREARKEGKKPNWMGDIVWNDLLEKWNKPTYRRK